MTKGTTIEGPWTNEGFHPIAGGRLHYVELGSGPPVVLLPKLGGWAADWRLIATALGEQVRLIVVEPPGHGESAMDVEPPQSIPIEQSARALLDLLRRLGIERAVLGGNSLGGCIALGAATLEPAFASGLLLVSCATGPAVSQAEVDKKASEPNPDFEPDGTPIARDPEAMARRNGNLDVAINDEMNASRAKAGRWIIPSEFGVGLADFHGMMAQVTAPTLLLYGERDPLGDAFAPDALRLLAQGVEQRVPGTGRFPQLEQPEATARIILDWLAGLPA